MRLSRRAAAPIDLRRRLRRRQTRVEGVRTGETAHRLRLQKLIPSLVEEDAQHKGAVTTALSGSQLLDMIESLAVGWTVAARDVLATPRQLKAERAAQRKAITEAVRRIVDSD